MVDGAVAVGSRVCSVGPRGSCRVGCVHVRVCHAECPWERVIERTFVPACLSVCLQSSFFEWSATSQPCLLLLCSASPLQNARLYMYWILIHYEPRCRLHLQALTSPPNADNHLCNHHCGICACPRGCARAPTAKLIKHEHFLSVQLHLPISSPSTASSRGIAEF